MSDLHLEMIANSDYIKTKEFEVCGDVLVLAGDIIYLRDIAAVYNGFWDWAARNYRQVLLIPGNHEFYGSDDIAKRGDSWHRAILRRPPISLCCSGSAPHRIPAPSA